MIKVKHFLLINVSYQCKTLSLTPKGKMEIENRVLTIISASEEEEQITGG
jgi:hypothetical protein